MKDSSGDITSTYVPIMIQTTQKLYRKKEKKESTTLVLQTMRIEENKEEEKT